MRDNLIRLNLQYFGEEGAEELEIAEPTPEEELVGEPQSVGTEEPEAVNNGNVQTKEDDAKYAAARRKSEREIQERDNEFAAKFGHIINPETNMPIRSQKDYFEALAAQERVEAEQELVNSGINPQAIQAILKNTPEFRNMTQIQARMQAAEQEKARADGLEYVNREVRELSKLDPKIKTAADLDGLEKIGDILSLCKDNKLTLTQAYKIAYETEIAARQLSKAKQEAINQVNGKSHLKQVGGLNEGTNDVFISESEMQTGREYYPDLTDSEIRKKLSAIK